MTLYKDAEKKFAQDELVPLLHTVEGPVDAFVPQGEVKARFLDQALEGDLVGATFIDAPAFDDLEQKRTRQEAKRAVEIHKILSEQREPTLEEVVIKEYADAELNRAVLVEAARRASLTVRGLAHEDMEPSSELIRRSCDHLYGSVTVERARECLGLFANLINEYARETASRDTEPFVADFLDTYKFIGDAEGFAEPVIEANKAEGIKRTLEARFGQAFQELREEFGEITNAKIVDVSNSLLQKLGCAAKDGQPDRGWRAESNEDRDGFFVNNEERILECGKRKKEITWDAYAKLMIHEIGVHLARGENARELGSTLLVKGLSNASEIEEGLAMLLEAIWQGKEGQISRDHYRYLIASYALGVLDGERHGIDDTFQFASGLMAVKSIITKIKAGASFDLEAEQKKARKVIFGHVFRAFRGMPEGEVFTKDTIYYANKASLVELINGMEGTPEQIMEYLLQAKFDPTNPEQAAFVKERKQIMAS